MSRRRHHESPVGLGHVVAGVGAAVGGAVVAGGISSVAAASYFARRVLTPERDRPDDTEILAVDGDEVTLGVTEATVLPGRYGLWLPDGHARVGDIVRTDDLDGRPVIVRRLLRVDRGTLAPGTARWNRYFYGDGPAGALDLIVENIEIDSDVGPLPTWVIPPATDSGRWAVLVHGRGALREECVRGIPALLEAGLGVIVPSYRNDTEAPPGPDGRYNLGLSEWNDIDEVVRYAVSRGAREIVLGGWSMGGAIVLQFLAQSDFAPLVSGAFLDCPVVDWNDVFAHHARLNHIPIPVALLAMGLMGRRSLHWMAGVSSSVDVARTNWVARADELHHRLLVIHSVTDDFVPIGPARALALARPDLVELDEWSEGAHCATWNVDPARWEEAVRGFVREVAVSGGSRTAR